MVASGWKVCGDRCEKGGTLLSREEPGATTMTGLGAAGGSAIRIQPGVTGVGIGDTEDHGFTLAAAAGDIAALYVAAGTSGLTARGSVLTAAGANAVLAEGGVSGLTLEDNTFDGTAKNRRASLRERVCQEVYIPVVDCTLKKQDYINSNITRYKH